MTESTALMEKPRRVAIVHDWLNGMRGGEKVLEAVLEIFPGSTIFTLHLDREKISPFLQQQDIRPSALRRMPLVKSKYRYYLPLFPSMIRKFKFDDFDMVLSLSHCAAKGVNVPAHIPHICYCFTPMRYAWHLYEDYFGSGRIKKALVNLVMKRMRRWDRATAAGVDYFIAISRHVAERISQCYGRGSEIIYPPVDTQYFRPENTRQAEDFYLIVSALVPYKRVDIAVQAFNMLKLPLKIVGAGTEYRKLKSMADKNISFHGWIPSGEIRDLYQRCRAFIFPGEEDFGLTPVEAIACGRPVIAYRKGGVLETVTDNATGIFFDEQTPDSLAQAVRRLRKQQFDPKILRQESLRFSRDRFKAGFKDYVIAKYNEFHSCIKSDGKQPTQKTRRRQCQVEKSQICL